MFTFKIPLYNEISLKSFLFIKPYSRLDLDFKIRIGYLLMIRFKGLQYTIVLDLRQNVTLLEDTYN